MTMTKEIFRDEGYKDISQFPQNSPIHEVADKWRWGGMAKEMNNGEWNSIRWDIDTTPDSDISIPHANQELFRPEGGKLKGFEKGPLDHFPLFSQLFGYQDSNSYTNQYTYINSNSNDRQSASSSGVSNSGSGGFGDLLSLLRGDIHNGYGGSNNNCCHCSCTGYVR